MPKLVASNRITINIKLCQTEYIYNFMLLRLYHTCTYSRLPEDEPSGSKHAEEIVKVKILV